MFHFQDFVDLPQLATLKAEANKTLYCALMPRPAVATGGWLPGIMKWD